MSPNNKRKISKNQVLAWVFGSIMVVALIGLAIVGTALILRSTAAPTSQEIANANSNESPTEPCTDPECQDMQQQQQVVVVVTGSDNEEPVIDTSSVTSDTECTPTAEAVAICPPAWAVAPGSASNVYTFGQDQVYHLNLSLEGAPAGVEGNIMFRVTKTFTARFDGSAWTYAGIITDPNCQYCDETSGDYTLTLANVPQLTGYVKVLDVPCPGIGPTTLPVHKLEIVQ